MSTIYWKIFLLALIIIQEITAKVHYGGLPNKIAKQQQKQQQQLLQSTIHANQQSKRVAFEVFSSCAMNLDVAIGTPARLFKLALNFIDAHTQLLMQPVEYSRVSKADPAMYKRQIYKPSTSKTFVDLKKNYTNPIYGDGLVAADFFHFPNNQPVAIPNGTSLGFVLMTNISALYAYLLRPVPTDGSLGFGPQLATVEGRIPSFLATISALMEQPPIFTFHFDEFNAFDPDEKKQHSHGVLSFSANDTLEELCEPDSWLMNMPIHSTDTWKIKLDSVFVGKGGLFIKNQLAIVDPTWSFFILVPSAQMQQLAKWLGAKKSEYLPVYEIPCNQTGNAPDIVLEFDNDGAFALAAAASYHSNNGSSRKKFGALFKGTDYIIESNWLNAAKTAANDDDKMCQLIFADGYKQWVLGYAFFNKHCLSLDLNMKKHKHNKSFGQTATVGFAAKKLPPPPQTAAVH